MFIFSYLFFMCTLKYAFGEVHTSVEDLKDVIDAEGVLIGIVDEYIQVERQKMEDLRRYMKVYKEKHAAAALDKEKYVSNPLNAYFLIKRLIKEWARVESLMKQDISADFLLKMASHKDQKFPTVEDLDGASTALARLQVTYNLNMASLTRGEINGVKYSSPLSAFDCFEIGKNCKDYEDFYSARLWIEEAYLKLKRVGSYSKKVEALQHLVNITHQQGKLSSALNFTNLLLEIEPENSVALWSKQLLEEKPKESLKEDQEKDETQNRDEYMSASRPLCRGEVSVLIEVSSGLKCKYVTNNKPFLLIAPFKMEEVSFDPYIVIFHDVMTDNEIEVVKLLAKPRFKRAGVGGNPTSRSRISKSSWLAPHESVHVGTIYRRVHDMTGLRMKTAEPFQVVNYGLGGHYKDHFDFARKHELDRFSKLESGNRIATVLFYMSDVEQGGATVFPRLGISVRPKKGSAVFWYNLYPSGHWDYGTLHAACPVLIGSKWVANVWIRERDQEFARPCELNRSFRELTPDPYE